ncbi:hypothetical protein [Arthrobacter sp. H5]|uniref:hypothetical protein n=1 Tax=Arthrobacter sp. H5 TaxID=1267973 RepID=UPI00047F8346|nr:hypothetical protein [Arthrobacter sp. H5]
MFQEWQRSRAAKRVKPGDGRVLKRFRWWQLLGRALFYLRLSHDDGHRTVYAVDLRHWGNQSGGEVKAHLYLDDRHHAESKIPAAFPVQGGTVEVAMSAVGVKRCHYVTAGGAEHQLSPDPKSAEGRRARLDSEHPALSRSIGSFSVILLIIGVVLLLLQIAGPISQIPPIAERIGTFESPLHLPLWLNIALGAGTAVASMERALRLRYSWLLDGVGN